MIWDACYSGDHSVSRIAWRLILDKSVLKRLLKWFVIINAVLAAFGILIGQNGEFVARVHGSSFLLVITAAGVMSIELGKAGDRLRLLWVVGSLCVVSTGVVLLALTWGVPLPEVAERPLATAAVVGVVATYCAVVSLISSRSRLRTVCWAGAVLHGLYVCVLIWFEVNLVSGRILALFAVALSACSLLAVIEFIGSRRIGVSKGDSAEQLPTYCPYCGAQSLVNMSTFSQCRDCGGKFQAAV